MWECLGLWGVELTVVEGVCVDAVAIYCASEIPELLEGCTLCRYHDNDNHLVCCQETHGSLAKTPESCAHSCWYLATPGVP
jgi:prenyltransferase beta subunit